MDSKNIHESKTVRTVVITISIVIIMLILLFVGMNIGTHRARFAGQFGQNYERNFMGPRGGMMGGFFDNERLPGGHGVIGEILSINLPQIIITGPDNLEKTVLVSTSTVIRQFQTNITSSELKIGDFVVIIGNPNNNGQVEARLVRVMPSPSQ
jgi:hypothetical protein